MQLVVVMAVRKAVRAATMTFTAISMMRLFMRHLLSVSVAGIRLIEKLNNFTYLRNDSVFGFA